MGYESFLYNVFLFLHVLAVIIGFGGVLLNGLYASRARRYTPDQTLAVMEVNGFVSIGSGCRSSSTSSPSASPTASSCPGSGP